MLLQTASEVERLGAFLAKHRLAATILLKKTVLREAAEFVGLPNATLAELQLTYISSRNCLEVKKRGLDKMEGQPVLYAGWLEGKVVRIYPEFCKVMISTERGHKLVSPFQLVSLRAKES